MGDEKLLRQQETEKILKGISIPPRPAILADIDAELQRPNPSLTIIANRINSDVGLTGTMLKVVNSPYFGLRSKINSPSHAVQTLGIRNVKSIVTGLVLKQALGGKDASLERFWDSAEKIARISTYIASILPKAPRDESYTFGLFHDCGIPLLMQRFPDYKDTLKRALTDPRALADVEFEQHGTNHTIVGHMVARSWGLSDTITEAVLRKDDISVFASSDPITPVAQTLIAINLLAKHLNDEVLRMRDDPRWPVMGNYVMNHLCLSNDELIELREDIPSVIS
jgi:HD-like signal output (HDOD) protein